MRLGDVYDAIRWATNERLVFFYIGQRYVSNRNALLIVSFNNSHFNLDATQESQLIGRRHI